MNKYVTFLLSMVLSVSINSNAQTDWIVPEAESKKLSIQLFDGDIQQEGKQIYTTSCKSCHGTPTQADFTMMAPPPGDVSEKSFRIQTDGELLYKIQKGRGTMPAFENTYTESELWSLIAYIRSFHEGYEQKLPNLEGIEIPKLSLSLDYDENIDKLVIKVADDKNDKSKDVNIKAYVKGMFGNHYLGKATTNENGIAWVNIDANLPGDEQGFVTVLLKATKGYGNAKLEKQIQAAKPTIKTSVIEGRHLWSKASKAPIWMIVIFNIIGFGIWATIFFIIIGLRNIKKLQ
jgi:cytochrome c5